MTDIAHEEGVFEENESKVIKNLLNFKEVLAKDVMTPRTVMKAENENKTVKTFLMKTPISVFQEFLFIQRMPTI